MRTWILMLGAPLFFACNTEKIFDGPNSYQDGFENYEGVEEMLDGQDEQWSLFQDTYEENMLEITDSIVHSGKKSLKCFARKTPSDGTVSKASAIKQKMAFWEHKTVYISAWYYVEDNGSAEWLFLFDLEEQAQVSAGPGMRLALENDMLVLEHKYPEEDVRQGEEGIPFPRNQWVHIEFETLLRQKKKGYVKVWQDDVLILEKTNHKTLPTDVLYAIQGTKGMYSSIEFGATANSTDNDQTVYVDDIEVKILE